MSKHNPDVFALKLAWIFHQADYSELRKAEGCSKMGDLPTTEQDKENAIAAARRMGIPDEEIHCFTGVRAKELDQHWRRLLRRMMEYCLEGKRMFMFLYCAGHGVADQQQYFVLNDAEHNLVAVEAKLRAMCKGSEGNFSVFAVYDICRSELSKFAGLRRGAEEHDVAGGPQLNYVAISGTDPRGTVPAASKLAVLLFREADLAAADHKHGLVKIPQFCIDFMGENGLVEKTMMGKSYYMDWLVEPGQQKAVQQEEEKVIEESKGPTPQQKVSNPQPVAQKKASGPWKPSLQRPIMFGQGSDPLIGRFPVLEDLHKLQAPPKLT